MRQGTIFPALALLALAGCNQVRDGFAPVLGDDATQAEKERFARRLHLDLTGLPPAAEETGALIGRLDGEGNTAKTRDAIAAELVARPAFAELYLSETENAAFSGQSAEVVYSTLCEIIRGTDAACLSCAEVDACQCDCPALAALGAEREALYTIAGDLMSPGGAATSDVERAIALSSPFEFNGTSPEGITTQLFSAFLGRPPEADELRNARFMVIGSLLPDSPAGLLFHRHGGDRGDLVDIVFDSEVYRDAMVARAFQRYLGRRPSSDELRFFSASLDAERPDLRPLVRAVVSSSEYFDQ